MVFLTVSDKCEYACTLKVRDRRETLQGIEVRKDVQFSTLMKQQPGFWVRYLYHASDGCSKRKADSLQVNKANGKIEQKDSNRSKKKLEFQDSICTFCDMSAFG